MTPILRGDVWWVSLDPTQGAEIQKTRPCLVLTSDVLNRFRQTVVVVPFSTSASAHPPISVAVTCQENRLWRSLTKFARWGVIG
jgi:mRNA interferase MazF